MDLSAVRLVVADMDGTLLNSNHEVSPLFYDLFAQLSQKGIVFAAASGRQHDSIVDKLQSIAGDISIIAENGGFAVHQGREIVSSPLPADQKNLILKAVEPLEDAHSVICGKYKAYLSSDSKEFVETLEEYYTQFNFLDSLYSHSGEVMKIAVYHDRGSEEHIYPYVKHLEGDLKVKVSGEHWVDISHPDANKGFALEILQNELGIGAHETLVFGDYNNDLEMLARADHSYAMANAHPNVLKAARYRTLSNDEFGVEKVLESLLRSKS